MSRWWPCSDQCLPARFARGAPAPRALTLWTRLCPRDHPPPSPGIADDADLIPGKYLLLFPILCHFP